MHRVARATLSRRPALPDQSRNINPNNAQNSMGQKSSTPSRYRAPQLLLDRGIPCVIWAEDALAHFGVKTALFNLFLLVHDPTQAASCLTAGGFIRVGPNEGYRHLPPLYEGVPHLIDPANREYSFIESASMESRITLLSAREWGYTLPDDTTGSSTRTPCGSSRMTVLVSKRDAKVPGGDII
jgi:hypothetical protein